MHLGREVQSFDKHYAEKLPLIEFLSEILFNRKQVRITHLKSEVLYASPSSFVVPLIEAADFYINNPTKYTASNASCFYGLCEQLLQRLFNLYGEFN